MKTGRNFRNPARNLGILFLVMIALEPSRSKAADSVSEGLSNMVSVDFGEERWDRSRWRALRLVNQDAPQIFSQSRESLFSDAFSSDEIKRGLDNALLATQIDQSNGEIRVTFSVGPEPGAAAGVFIGKDCSADVFFSGTVVFVADNRLAVWSVESDRASKTVKYTHLGQLAHAFKVGQKHVLKYSFDGKGNIAVSVDNTDVLSFRNCQVGSTLGIWGCHGSTSFFAADIGKVSTLSSVSPKTQ